MPSAAARSSSRHRFLIAFSTVAIVLLGFFALGRLPIDLLHVPTAPIVRVQVSVPGVMPSVIGEKITLPLEQALAGIGGVTSVESITTPDGVVIDLHLKHRRETAAVQQDIPGRLERVKSLWPASVDSPTVSIIDDASVTEEFFMTSRGHDLLGLRDWAEGEFAKKLRELSGVATVEVEGGAVREILVIPDQRRLAGLGLAFDDVLKAIRKNPEAEAGTWLPTAKGRGRREAMQSGNVAAVAAMSIALSSGENIALSEVARVMLGKEVKPAEFHFDGAEAVKVTVLNQPQVVMSKVVESINAHIEWMRANRLIPEGIEIHPVAKRLAEVRQTLRRMAVALIAGVSLVLIAAYLLLGTGRRTVILGMVIVSSLLAAFIAMALLNLALDVMTLGGLGLGTGLFATTAMVMFENKQLAAHNNTSVVLVIAISIAVPATLSPLLFTDGETGVLFRNAMLVFCGAWLASAFLALMLVSAFDKRGRRRTSQQRNAVVSHAIVRVRQTYIGLLRGILRYPSVMLVMALLLAGVMTAIVFLGREEFNSPDDKRAAKLVLYVQGPDFARLTALGDELVRRLRPLPDLHAVKHSAQALREVPILRLDDVRARELDIDITEVGKALTIALTGIPAGSLRDAEHRYDIRLRLDPEKASHATGLGRTLLRGELDDRPAVFLQDVATVERANVPEVLHRYNGLPIIEVTVLPAIGSSSIQALTHVREALKNYLIPTGYHLTFGTPGEALAAVRGDGLKWLGEALLFLFAALILLLRSIRLATLITLTACSALGGVGAALLIFDMPMSSAAWLGASMLIGITAGYAIAPAMHLMALDVHGLPVQKKVLRSATHQFRPLLAITFMSILGMLPLMLASGDAFVLRPLFIVVITGLFFSFAACALLMPLIYIFIIFIAPKEQSHGRPRL